MVKSKLGPVTPTADNRTVLMRRPNAELPSPEYLTDAEVARLMKAAAIGNRYGHRDIMMILVASMDRGFCKRQKSHIAILTSIVWK
jgi:hypothetical protein